MRLATIAQARRIDQRTQAEGLSAETLMDHAGTAAARHIFSFYRKKNFNGAILVVCGPGNNGGDGEVVARRLSEMGISVRVLRAASARGRPPLESMKGVGLIVDALFGIGLNRPLEGGYQSLIDSLNASKIPIVSLDTPSGLHADTGEILGTCIKARLTVTFGLAKPGFFIRRGPEVVGRLKVEPISFPREILVEEANTHFLLTRNWAHKLLPTRDPLTNKAQQGKVNIVAGSEGKWGAAILSIRAAFRAGVGYVRYLAHEPMGQGFRPVPEALYKAVPEALTGTTAELGNLLDEAFAVGPGSGVGTATRDVMKRLRGPRDGNGGAHNVILDADALTAWAQENLGRMPDSWIWTPHTGELSRMIGVSSSEIEADRSRWAVEGQKRFGGILVLKGFHPLIVSDGKVLIVNAGNDSLAKAGTGDVLTGLIGGFLGQGFEPKKAAAIGCFVHGSVADDWVRIGCDSSSLFAGDLVEGIPLAIKRLRRGLT